MRPVPGWAVLSFVLSLLVAGCDRPEPAANAAGTGPPAGAASSSNASSGASITASDPAGISADTSDATPHADPDRDPSFETVLAPLHDVEIVARLDGEVVGIQVEEGAWVNAGTALARLDDRERRAVLDEREAEVARAESAWTRAQRLQTEHVNSEEEFVEARSVWQIAKARRDEAEIAHARCTVRAPISGIVSRRNVQVGQMVKDGAPMFRVSDPNALRAELLLPEIYRGRLHAGQPVRLLPVVGGSGALARVTRVNPMVDPASGTFRVVIDLDNRRSRLPAGISVRAEFDPPLNAAR